METWINGITHNNMGKPKEKFTNQDINRINELYVCFDFMCNLHCPHCTLRTINIDNNLQYVYDTLQFLDERNSKFTINLFGGEPMLLKDEELKKFENLFNKHPLIISTNLLVLSRYKISLMKNCEDVNTSWNPQRFSKSQMELWENNLKIIQNENIPYSVMITLTKDLIENYTPQEFCSIIGKWKKCRNIDLKQMIGDKSIDFEMVDEWLCNLYDCWNITPKNLFFDEIERVIRKEKIWKNYCESYFTLLPNGNLKDGCPYFEYKTNKDFCLMCEYYNVCKGGCNIQEKCTFPKKLYEKAKNR